MARKLAKTTLERFKKRLEEDKELDRLDTAWDLQVNSRLGCQAVIKGDVVVTPGRWRTTDRFDASLEVLATLDHEVSRRGAFAAYVGSRLGPGPRDGLGTARLARRYARRTPRHRLALAHRSVDRPPR